MTAEQRKQKTETLLKQLNIPLNPALPAIEEDDELRIRPTADIAKRILILTYLNIVVQAEGFKDAVITSLKDKGLWDDVTAHEKELLAKDELTDQDRIDISWHSEAAWILLWVIGKVEITELPTQECDINEILKLLPSFEDGITTFTDTAANRTTAELLDMSDLLYRLLNASRDAEQGKPLPVDLIQGVLQERLYALNWATYRIEGWDAEG